MRREGQDEPEVFVFSGGRMEGDPGLGVLTIRDETERWSADRRYRIAFETDPAPGAGTKVVCRMPMDD